MVAEKNLVVAFAGWFIVANVPIETKTMSIMVTTLLTVFKIITPLKLY
jgi:hypothetical protein